MRTLRNTIIKITAITFVLLISPSLLVAQVGEERIKTVCQNITKAVNEGDADLFNAQFDLESMFDKAFARFPNSPQKKQFLTAVKKQNLSDFADGLTELVKDGATYQYTGAVKGRGIIRLNEPGDLNYHVISFTRAGKVNGMYFCATGSDYSEIAVDLFLGVAKKHGEAAIVGPQAKTMFADMSKYQAADETDDVDLALNLIEKLSPAGKKRKDWMLSALAWSTMSEDPEDFKKQWMFHQKNFPNDPGAALTGVSHFIDIGALGAATKQVDLLERTFGGDAYLNQLRGDILLAGEKWEAALAKYKLAARADQESFDPLIGLFDALNGLKRFDKAVDMLKFMDKKHGVSITDRYLKSEEQYSGLVTSDVYKEFRP